MKKLVLLCFFTFSVAGFSQDSTQVKAPKIIAKLGYGKTMSHDGVSVKFVKVISDSRCPKGVTCIWAGEAKVLLDVYKNDVKIEQRTITVSSGYISDMSLVFASDDTEFHVANLSPYPEYDIKIQPEAYYLQLVTKAIEEH